MVDESTPIGGSAVASYIPEVVQIIAACVSAQADPDVRIRYASRNTSSSSSLTLSSARCSGAHHHDCLCACSMIRTLSSVVRTPDCVAALAPFAHTLLAQILIPVCVWRAGRGPAAAREAGLHCIEAVLGSGIVSAEVLSSVRPQSSNVCPCMRVHVRMTVMVVWRVRG